MYDDFEALYELAHTTLLNDLRVRMFRGVSRSQTTSSAASYDGGINGVLPEDIAQETWLRVWRAWPRLHFANESAACAYLFRTAQHILVDHLRHQQMRRRRGHVRMTETLWEELRQCIPDETPAMQPETRLLIAETQETLQQVVQRTLSASGVSSRNPERDVALLAADMDGESTRATAERLGMTIGSVKTRQWRLRLTLRAGLREALAADAAEEADAEEVAV